MSRSRLIVLVFTASLFFSCRDEQAVVDTNQEVSGRNWGYADKIKIPVVIKDTQAAYNLFINLRHTANYKYSNIFILVHQTGPDGKRTTEREEFRLAYPDGEWLGDGSGNMYSYQLPYQLNYKFPKKGSYVFELEQNMRDNPLREITDAGLRVEKAAPANP